MRGKMTVASKAEVKTQLDTAEATIKKALDFLVDGEDQLARDCLEGYTPLPVPEKVEKPKAPRKPRAKKTETTDTAGETSTVDPAALN